MERSHRVLHFVWRDFLIYFFSYGNFSFLPIIHIKLFNSIMTATSLYEASLARSHRVLHFFKEGFLIFKL